VTCIAYTKYRIFVSVVFETIPRHCSVLSDSILAIWRIFIYCICYLKNSADLITNLLMGLEFWI